MVGHGAKIKEETGQNGFYGHPIKSAEMAKDILKNLGYSNDEISKICFFIKFHDEFIPIKTIEDATDERITKILNSILKREQEYEPTISDFRNLIRLCKADSMAQNEVIEMNGKVIDTMEKRIQRLEQIDKILSNAVLLDKKEEVERD